MDNRTTGRRRSEEDLEQHKADTRKTKFTLVDQIDFKGSKELLSAMQDYERSYREGRPTITDEEWDGLIKETGYIESLDQVVSPSGRKWMRMSTPLVSLSKVCTVKDIKKMFDSSPGESMIISPKLDGLTYTAFYYLEDDELIRKEIGTRGDGLNSLILHEDALDSVNIHWLPLKIDKEMTSILGSHGCIIDGVFELRGEAVIDKYEYAESNGINLETMVPRTIASGMFNRKMSYSIKSIYKNLWMDTNMTLVEHKDIFSKYDKIWKATSKGMVKTLSGFNIVNKKTAIDSMIVVKNERNGLSAYVRERDSGKIRPFSRTEDKGKSRVENLYFISFSVSSILGNIDRPFIIQSIKGAKYVGDIKDFDDIFTITNEFDAAMKCIDSLYGTNNGVRDMNKERIKLTSRFALDGIVIKPSESNAKTQQTEPVNKNGKMVVPNKPKDQVAVKFETDPVKTKIISITRKTTSLGNITVTAQIVPTVVEGGATVSNVNLHNEKWIALPENSWLKEGVECNLKMSMDIIPILSQIK